MTNDNATRTCQRCKQDLPASAFGKTSGRRDGLHTHCRECCKLRHRATPGYGRRPVRCTTDVLPGQKGCPKCNQSLPLSAFGADRSRPSGLHCYCKECINVAARSRPADHTSRVKQRERIRQARVEAPLRTKSREAAAAHNRRAKQYGVPGRLTTQHVLWIWDYHGHKCKDCGTREDLTLDHVKPMSLGGTNWPANLQVACRACNYERWLNYEG